MSENSDSKKKKDKILSDIESLLDEISPSEITFKEKIDAAQKELTPGRNAADALENTPEDDIQWPDAVESSVQEIMETDLINENVSSQMALEDIESIYDTADTFLDDIETPSQSPSDSSPADWEGAEDLPSTTTLPPPSHNTASITPVTQPKAKTTSATDSDESSTRKISNESHLPPATHDTTGTPSDDDPLDTPIDPLGFEPNPINGVGDLSTGSPPEFDDTNEASSLIELGESAAFPMNESNDSSNTPPNIPEDIATDIPPTTDRPDDDGTKKLIPDNTHPEFFLERSNDHDNDEDDARLTSTETQDPTSPSTTNDDPSSKTVLFEFDYLPRLEVQEGNMPRKTYQLSKKRTVIGRAKSCDIVLFDANCSREHAEVIREGPDFFVEDLGSKNGTLVNEFPIPERQKLNSGDTLTFGGITFEFLEGVERASGIKKHDVKIVEEDPRNLFVKRERLADQVVTLIKRHKKRILLYSGLLGIIAFTVISDYRKKISEDSAPQPPPTDTSTRQSSPQPTDGNTEKSRRLRFLLNQAQFLFNNGDYTEALKKFDLALRVSPDNKEIRMFRDKTDAAIQLQKEIRLKNQREAEMKAREKQIKSLEDRAMSLINQREYGSAMAILKKLERIDPESELLKKYLPIVDEKLTQESNERLKAEKLQKLIAEHLDLAESYYTQQSTYAAIQELQAILKEEINPKMASQIKETIQKWEDELRDRLSNKLEAAKASWENGEKLQAKRILTEILGEYPEYKAANEEYEKVSSQLQAEAFQYYNDCRVHEANDDILAALESCKKVFLLLEPSDEYYKKAEDKVTKLERFQ